LPLLQELGVHLYLSGHSHSLQLLELTGEPLYVISGGGGRKPKPLLNTSLPHQRYAAVKLGFVLMVFQQDYVRLEYISTGDGLLRDINAEVRAF
jgi:tartrate-resistant acid phosphatase type 5